MKGKNRFISIVRKLSILSEENTCGWTEEQFEEMANSIENLVQLNSRAEVSKDGAEMEELYGERNGYGERSHYGERGNYGERGGEGYGERRMRDGRGRYTTNY